MGNEPIKCGKFLDAVKKISDILFKGFDKLVNMGFEFSDKIDEPKEGVKVLHVTTGNGDEFDVTLTEVTDKLYNMKMTTKDGKTKEIKNVNLKDSKSITEPITDFVNDVFEAGVEEIKDEKGNDIMNNTNSSKKLSVTLKRVCASTEDEIHLTSVNANYSACDALDNLDAVLSDNDFVSQITEEPQTFSIIDEGDSLDVATCDECEAQSDSYILTMITNCLCLRDLMQFIHWNAKGENMRELHSEVENYYWRINNEIDVLAELQVELFGFMPNPGTLCNCACYNELNTTDGFTAEQGYDIMKDAINGHISELQLYYCNFTSHVQSILDDWIRSWSKASNYFIKQIRKA